LICAGLATFLLLSSARLSNFSQNLLSAI